MAEEKRHVIIPEASDEWKTTKTKKNRSPTVCSDQRRQAGHCGICGFGDLVMEGIQYCNICGREELVLEPWHWWHRHHMSCCEREETYRNWKTKKWQTRKVQDIRSHVLSHCPACGAVERPKCPACGHVAWFRGLEVYCRSCGYRRRKEE